MSNFNNIPKRDRVIVALDCSEREALRLADILQGRAKWVKVGMTLYYSAGPAIVAKLQERGFNVFLDLKFFDIPHQVRGAAEAATKAGANMLTIHASGGQDMLRAAAAGAAEAALELGVSAPITLGITVLTSMDAETLAGLGVARPLEDQVKHLASLALDSGLSGVVCSATEAKMLRAQLGRDAYIVTPGIRPEWAAPNDQARIVTPAAAFEYGASHIVVGRPITAAKDALAAFDKIAEELA